MKNDTSNFIQEPVIVEDADAMMVFGATAKAKPLDVKRLVLISVATDEIVTLANLVAQELGMTVHIVDDASDDAIQNACALDHAILLPSPSVVRQSGVLAQLSAPTSDVKVFFSMVNPVRVAVALGLSGDEGEAFCREAIALEDMCLGMAHMVLPDGSSPEELKENILQGLGHVSITY